MAIVWGRLVCEALVAAMTTVEAEDPARFAYAHRRVQNAWLVQLWPFFEGGFQEFDDDRLALYLALGWTQATTTHQWPSTERWIEIMSGEAPTHWLPRSQWHLCWLLFDPEDRDHRRGLDEALREGLGDGDRPGVAEALREIFPLTPLTP